MADQTQPISPPPTSHWPGGGRAAALFVGVPLTAALVLAATPLSDPPAAPPALSALPSRVAAPVATRGPAAEPLAERHASGRDCDEVVRRGVAARRSRATPAVVMAPRILTAVRAFTGTPSRAVGIAQAAPRPLAPRSIVVVAHGVERVELQSP